MKVRNVMETNVITIPLDSTYGDAAQIMHRHHFSGLPVVDDEGKLAGVVSEKDLFRAMFPVYGDFYATPEKYHNQEEQEDEIDSLRFSPITEHMTRRVLTIGPDAPILRAGGIMLARHVHRLPVVENEKLVGIVTRCKIFGAVLESRLDLQDSVTIERIAHSKKEEEHLRSW